MPEFVSVTVADAVAVIVLDRPPLNLINTQAARELADAARDAVARPDVRAVVVHGGDKIFSAGDDLAELDSFTDQQQLAVDVQALLGCLAAVPLPVVAAISGYALGSGLELALGADRRIIGDNAKLAMPQVRSGLVPRGGGTQRLAALTGPALASDLVLTGRFVDAEEALSLGLAEQLVPPDEVLASALTWAAQFREVDRSALIAAKTAISGGYATERAQAATLLTQRRDRATDATGR